MKIMKSGKFVLAIALLLSCFASLKAQESADSISVAEAKPKASFLRWGCGVEGSVLFNDYSSESVMTWGLHAYYRLNTNFSVGLGIRVMYWNGYERSWSDGGYCYTYLKETDDDGESNWRRQFDLVASASYILPVIKRGGIVLGGSAYICPIPIEHFKVSRYQLHESVSPSFDHLFSPKETKSKYVFDAFQPGLFAEAGIYYDLHEDGTKNRFSLTYGVGTFDMFRGSRHSTVFGQKLGRVLHERSLYHSLTLRLTVF